ncbi:hypothetical protein [Adhaeribacter arboris]|uniref:hypothetical protein n=1 Tax=Adhaeribacter arboris TaxID=2072846 RepID=UPI001304E9BA|nr:hypothetical protein [Adhaeribacter arboris]
MEASEIKNNDKTEAWLNEMEYEWMEEYSNWVNTQTGDILSDFQPSEDDLKRKGAIK